MVDIAIRVMGKVVVVEEDTPAPVMATVEGDIAVGESSGEPLSFGIYYIF